MERGTELFNLKPFETLFYKIARTKIEKTTE